MTNTSYTRDTTGSPSVTITYVPSTPGGGGGGGDGGGGGGNNGSPLVLSALKASSRSFKAAGHGGSTGGTVGTTISYTGSAGATTTFTVLAPRSGIRNSRGRLRAQEAWSHGQALHPLRVGGQLHPYGWSGLQHVRLHRARAAPQAAVGQLSPAGGGGAEWADDHRRDAELPY